MQRFPTLSLACGAGNANAGCLASGHARLTLFSPTGALDFTAEADREPQNPENPATAVTPDAQMSQMQLC